MSGWAPLRATPPCYKQTHLSCCKVNITHPFSIFHRYEFTTTRTQTHNKSLLPKSKKERIIGDMHGASCPKCGAASSEGSKSCSGCGAVSPTSSSFAPSSTMIRLCRVGLCGILVVSEMSWSSAMLLMELKLIRCSHAQTKSSPRLSSSILAAILR